MGSTDTSVAGKAAKSLQNETSSNSSALSGSVGFGGDNKPDDVRTVSDALVANGRLDIPKSEFSNEIGSKIITAQQDMGDNLKPDGLVKPGGPTENRFRKLSDDGLMKPPAPSPPLPAPTGGRPASGDAAVNAQASVRAKKRALADARSKTRKSLNDPDRTPFQKAQNVRRIENAKREVQEAQQRANRLAARKRDRERTERLKQMQRDQKEMADKSQVAKKTIADALSSAIENLTTDQTPTLPPVSDEVVAANNRSAKYLASRRDMHEFPRWEIEDIETQGAPAIAKTADLIRQTREIAPEQAERLYQRTVVGISPENRVQLAAALQQQTEPRGLEYTSRNRKERRETVTDRASHTRRNLKEGFLRTGATAAGTIGLELSAQYLKRFLDGSGKEITVSRDQARQDSFVLESEVENRRRFEEDTFLGKTDNPALNDKIRTLEDGQSVELDDYWKRDLSFGEVEQESYGDEVARVFEPDRLLAFGSLQFRSDVDATATRQGNIIHIEGTVTHSGDDRYDFENNDEAFGAYELQESDRGTPFWVRQNWRQKVTGTVRILGEEDGKLVLGQPHFQWKDVD